MLKYLISSCLTICLFSCASTQLKPVIYKGSLPAYPAVTRVLSDRQVDIESVDVFNDEVCSGYIYVVDLMVPYRFKVLVRNSSGYIRAKSVGMQFKDTAKGMWSDHPSMLVFDINKYLNDFSQEISAILVDPQEYAASKNKAFADLSVVYLIIQNMTDVGRDQWVADNLIGRDFTINLPLDAFYKNSDKRIDKGYTALFSYRKGLSGLFADFAICLYTDNDTYAKIRVGGDVSVKGSLVKVEKSVGRALFSLLLIE